MRQLPDAGEAGQALLRAEPLEALADLVVVDSPEDVAGGVVAGLVAPAELRADEPQHRARGFGCGRVEDCRLGLLLRAGGGLPCRCSCRCRAVLLLLGARALHL